MNVYLGGLYKEVEYIETSGTQYIETPFKTQDGYLHKTKVRYLSFNTNWCSFGGGYSIGPEARFFLGARSDRNQWTWGLGNYSGDLGSVSTGVDYELEAKLYNGSQSFIVNGSTLKTDTFSFSASERYNVCLIGSSYYDATLAWSSTRVYYYQLYDSSNNLVLDMIPCYRVSDNEIGMFDKVNNQFYTNSGTGTFIKGSDVKTFQKELQNAYIGEVYEYSYDFRNKTTTQLANDGWTNTSSLTTGANGVTASSWNKIYNQLSGLGTAMSNAKKITINMLMYDAGNLSSFSSVAGVTLTTGTDAYTQTGIYANENAVAALCGSVSEVITKSQSVYNTQGDYTLSAVFDFVNKTVSVVFPSVYTGSASLTDAGITTAKTNNTLGCPLQNDRYLKTISILIEK